MICGSRVRVEFSHGRGRSNRGGGRETRRRSNSRSPRPRKPFSPHDICYECGGKFSFSLKTKKRIPIKFLFF